MHLGYITSEYPHPKVLHAAGIGTSIKNLALALVKKGVKVSIFVYHQTTDEIFEDQGIKIHLIKKKKYRFFSWFLYRKQLQNYINTLVINEKIDVLEAPDWTGITAFMRFKVPLVIRFHGSDAYFCKLEQRKQKLKNFLFEKLALKGATSFIAPTAYAGKETAKIFGLDSRKIKTIHYGLELERFVNVNPKTYQPNTILYVGTIIRKKGVFELIKIFNQVIINNPEAKLTLIGSDAPDLKTGSPSTYDLISTQLSPEAKSNFCYLGKVPYDQIKSYIVQAHICVFPSFAETLGMVTIESMALQKPVVNTSIGWAQEIIDDGENGYLVHPTEIDLYAEKIITLFKNLELCQRIGEAASKKVEATFDIKKQADKNIAFYKSLL